MKISEVPIAQAEKEIGTRFRSGKHLELLEKIKEMDPNFAFIIQCENVKEVDCLQAVIYNFKKRNNLDDLIINQSKIELKLFIRKKGNGKVKRGRPRKDQ